MKRPYAMLLLIAICLVAYGNSLLNDFTYDDKGMMDEELFSNVHDLGSFLTMDYYRFSGEMTFRPLVTLTYFLDFLFWYFLPFGFHLANLLWHVATVIVVYLLLCRFFRAPLPALLGAIVFAIHPVLTEAVNSVGFREDLMCAFFFLLALLLFIQIREAPLTPPSPQGGEGVTTARTVSGLRSLDYLFPYVISLLSFFLALLSKEMAVTLPLIFIIYDLLFSSRRHAGFRKRAIIYVGYALVVLAYLALRYVIFYNPGEQAVGYASRRLPVRLGAVPQLFSLYLRMFILPIGLSVEYDDSVIRPFVSFYSFAALAIMALFIALIVRSRRRAPRVCFALSFVLVSLLPMLDIVPISNMIAERYLYLPCFGAAMLAALLFDALSRAGGKRTVVLASVLAFILYGSATMERNAVWRNGLTLWSDGVRKAPGSARARLNLGVALGDKGDATGAIAQYEESMRLRPTSPDAYNNLGLLYFSKGKIDRAIGYYRKSIDVDPMQVKGYMNLALALIQKGEKGEGTRIVERLVAIKPMNAPLKCNLGNIYLEDGQYEKAAEQFNAALKIKPYHFDALQGLGKLYFQEGKWDESAAYFDRACSAHGASYARSISMGNIYYAQGRLDKAEVEYRKATELKPRLAEGYNNLGLVYQRKKDYDSAARDLKKALGCAPGNPTILLNLAKVLYLDHRAPEARDCIARLLQAEKIPDGISLDLARFYYRNKLYKEAIDTYGRILDKRPDYGWGYFHVARAYALLGESDRAEAWLNKGARYLTDEQIKAIAGDPAFAAIVVGDAGTGNK